MSPVQVLVVTFLGDLVRFFRVSLAKVQNLIVPVLRERKERKKGPSQKVQSVVSRSCSVLLSQLVATFVIC